MKSVKLNIYRYIKCITLLMVILISSTLSVSAAGVETWGKDTAIGPWEDIRVTNDNWTPVKTMGRSGTLIIDNFITPCNANYCTCADQEPTSYPQLNVNIKIVNYDTGEVLADEWFRQHIVFSYELKTTRAVAVGERLRVYFDVCSLNNPPGPYRKAHIQFRHRFV